MKTKNGFGLAKRAGTILKPAITCLLAISLSACGGGGGGGGSGSGSSARRGIRLLHAALDTYPAQITRRNGTEAVFLQSSSFAKSSFYAALPDGISEVQLSRLNDPAENIASLQVDLSDQARYSLLLHGLRAGSQLKAVLIPDSPPELEDSHAAVRLVNGVQDSLQLALLDQSASLSTAKNGQAADYAIVTPGPHQLGIVETGRSQPLGRATFDLQPGRAYTVLASGERGYFVSLSLFED